MKLWKWLSAWLVGLALLATPQAPLGASDCSVFVAAGGTLRYYGEGLVPVTCYGARGDNSTNDTAALNAAFASGYSIYIPCGNYHHTGLTITLGIVVDAGGPSCSILTNTTNGNSLTVSSTGNLVLKNFQLARSVASAGTALYGQHVSRLIVDNVVIQNANENDCITFDGFSQINLRSVQVGSCTNDGIKIYDSTAFGAAEFYCDPHTLVTSVGHDGIVIGGGNGAGGGPGGVRIDCGAQTSGRYGLFITASIVAAPNSWIFINQNATFDLNVSAGIFIDTNSFSAINMTGGWVASTTAGPAIWVKANTGSINVNGMQCIANNSDCLNLDGVLARLGWKGNLVLNNNGWGVSGTAPTASCAGGNNYGGNASGTEQPVMTHYNNTVC
jgi:hypothetical protein